MSEEQKIENQWLLNEIDNVINVWSNSTSQIERFSSMTESIETFKDQTFDDGLCGWVFNTLNYVRNTILPNINIISAGLNYWPKEFLVQIHNQLVKLKECLSNRDTLTIASSLKRSEMLKDINYDINDQYLDRYKLVFTIYNTYIEIMNELCGLDNELNHHLSKNSNFHDANSVNAFYIGEFAKTFTEKGQNVKIGVANYLEFMKKTAKNTIFQYERFNNDVPLILKYTTPLGTIIYKLDSNKNISVEIEKLESYLEEYNIK